MTLRSLFVCVCVGLWVAGCERVPLDNAPASASGGIVIGEHDRWHAGTHFERVEPVPEMTAPHGKVKVVEFFWYGCPHCYTLDPHLVLWNRRKPQSIEFERVPTTWGPYDRPHARLFYTLEVLGRTDLHAAIFDTIHGRGNRLATDDEQQTLRLQSEFAKQHGIDQQQFLDAYNSKAVAARLQTAEELLRRYKVEKLPTLVVNGKYKTDVTRTGRSAEALMRLIGDLSASETDARGVN
jgi:thiol:disulfide interchange protein DsbA